MKAAKMEKTNVTEISAAIELETKYGANNYAPPDVVFVRGKGNRLYSENGTEYLDFQGAYSANIFGHCYPPLVDALRDQAGKLALTSRAFRHDLLGALSAEIAEFSGLDRFIPMVTGGEAVDTAVKIARKYAYKKMDIPLSQGVIITCENNFHGRSVTVVSFSSETQYHDMFGPHTPGFIMVPFGDIDILKKLFRVYKHYLIGILLEPVQGEGGINVPPAGFLAEVRELCDSYGKLLITDEVQTGFGRTGYRFGYSADGVLPDLASLGKALGGGLIPVSGVIGKDEVIGVLEPGDHGSTFGGYSLACRVALETIRLYEKEGITEKASELGKRFHEGLLALNHPQLEEIRARGLMVGIKPGKGFGTPQEWATELRDKHRILTGIAHDVLRFTPPIAPTTEEDVRSVVDAVGQIRF